MAEKLAILGGSRVIPPGTIKPWPPIDDTDRKMVLASLEGANGHAFGPNCVAFQQEFAAWNGNKHALTTNSGTAALHMALVACGVQCGDEVIVPAYSWSSSATCVMQHNCLPVFVDIDFDTMNVDPDLVEAAITPKTRAIIAVHLHGLAADMDRLMAIADQQGLKVVEDACQAHGAKLHGKKVGTLGHCAAFSFNQNKCLCAGEGGMFVTDDEAMLARAQALWSFGEGSAPTGKRDYHVYAMGWMYRNGDLPAAWGRAQLAKLDHYLAVQAENAACLTQHLQGVRGLILPTVPEGYHHNWYNYTIRFDMEALGHAHDAAAFRDRLVAALRAEGLDTGIWQSFILPAMTVFQAKDGYGHGCPWSCPQALPVTYDVTRYPVSTRHLADHTGITYPLRAPHDTGVAKLIAQAISKVMAHLDQVEQIKTG
jgi:dTDP-4-amino-4,6-dideoxygalactose transaminase